jgi:hypothetical protein
MDELTASIAKLEAELARLRSKDKLSTERIRALSGEIIRLRGMNFVFG